MRNRKLIWIGVAGWLAFSALMVWAMFFPSQGFLRATGSRARSVTISYAKSLTGGVLIAESVHKTRFSSGRIVYLLDDGTMYSRYFNRPKYIKGISSNLVWTSASGGLSLVLPTLENGPKMKEVIADCGVTPVAVEIDSLGYLLVTREDGVEVRCHPRYGTGVSPFAKDETIVYGSVPVRLVNENRASRVAFDGHMAYGRLLDAKFAETMTSQEKRRNLFIAGEPLIEFQKSLTVGSPRYLGRYSLEGVRWEIPLGNNNTSTITQVHSYFLRGRQLIVLGYNRSAKPCAVAIDTEIGEIRWEKQIK